MTEAAQNTAPKSKNRSANQAAIALIAETYPLAFSRDSVKPLKIGIQEDLVSDGKLAAGKIKRALASYVRSPLYYKSMQEGAERVDLEGKPAGLVTAEEAAHAKEMLKKIRQQRREQQLQQEKQAAEQQRQERLNSKLALLVNKPKN
ncbi:MAG TPA: ProQ/FinO family protein [Motiliproteus sp.]